MAYRRECHFQANTAIASPQTSMNGAVDGSDRDEQLQPDHRIAESGVTTPGE
jgi:hypothetical protein